MMGSRRWWVQVEEWCEIRYEKVEQCPKGDYNKKTKKKLKENTI